MDKYNNELKPSRESYFYILKDLSFKYGFDLNNVNINESLVAINDHYKENDQELIDSLKSIIGKTGSQYFDDVARLQFKLILTVQF